MPALIVLNGPPGSGKSTIARRYADQHPLTLNLDVDVLRALIGGWQSDPGASGLAARAIALAAARVHLDAGHDVIVPQFLGRPAFLDQLADLACQAGAAFHEIVLMISKDEAVRRFGARTVAAADPAHLAAQEMLDAAGGVAELTAMYDRLQQIIADRPGVQLLPAPAGQVDETYQELLRRLGDSVV